VLSGSSGRKAEGWPDRRRAPGERDESERAEPMRFIPVTIAATLAPGLNAQNAEAVVFVMECYPLNEASEDFRRWAVVTLHPTRFRAFLVNIVW
jgi:hypothetical protein